MKKIIVVSIVLCSVILIAGCQGSDDGQDLTMTSEQILITSQVQNPTTSHSTWQKPSPYPTSMPQSTSSPKTTPTHAPTSI